MIIVDIDMPESCSECFAFKGNDVLDLAYKCKIKEIWFGENDLEWLYKQRPNWCPLFELYNAGECYKR